VPEEADYSSLRSNVSFLGRLLGETIAEAEGLPFLELIEQIRLLSKTARGGEHQARRSLLEVLHNLDDEQLVPVARAFSQFLNLANIADQHHTMSREMDPLFSAAETLRTAFGELAREGIGTSQLLGTVNALRIELVLTAHPTEITRRTLIHKHGEITHCLRQLELQGRTERELRLIHARLRELIAQVWYGFDFRKERPSPVDEAKWGFAVLEGSLWQAVPEFMRCLDSALAEHCAGARLPLDAAPVSFVSWMGGDRDGNPNVTATVTAEVLLLSRWQAADLYLREIVHLIDELSMAACDERLAMLTDGAREPYRAMLRPLRDLLRRTLGAINDELAGKGPARHDVLLREEQLWEPLKACYDSMLHCGMRSIADGALLDLLRRVRCFGVHLVRHDIRQDSARHTDVLSQLTRWLGLGDYAQWDEPTRQGFLLCELQSRRPLIPPDWEPDDDAREVLDTCAGIARQPRSALGSYIISMAGQPSDVLAVHLLLKASGCRGDLPVTPLFETLSDLENAREVIGALLQQQWYRSHIGGKLMVMIGYSDSAKDAGVLAASWAQYRAQEELLALCAAHSIDLTLFHGRGGTIGRGGAPAHAALLSQPPGSLRSGLRVTEQGEMIRAKLGLAPLAVQTLALYTSAICKANLLTPPAPEAEWREVMASLAADSCRAYREVLRGEPDFVEYFRYATPVQELAMLPLGSRPARRKTGGGIESLRAIPWIFAWTQNRLMLPAWLGAGAALQAGLQQGKLETLQDMARRWPFFATRMAMLEMVFAKADSGLSDYYDDCLVPEHLKRIGSSLRVQLEHDMATVLSISDRPRFLDDQPWIRRSIQLRNIYTDPLNFLQAELLRRARERGDPLLDQAIMVTIAGVAAGMRNTG
jgi:phosphoenolpyruvate carboxylase